jgi:hypothetical protein
LFTMRIGYDVAVSFGGAIERIAEWFTEDWLMGKQL